MGNCCEVEQSVAHRSRRFRQLEIDQLEAASEAARTAEEHRREQFLRREQADEQFISSCITPNCSPSAKVVKQQIIDDVVQSATEADLLPPNYFNDPILHQDSSSSASKLKLVPISPESPLFSQIERIFNSTTEHLHRRKYQVKTVRRIENNELWRKYSLARFKMEKLIELGIHAPCNNKLDQLNSRPYTHPAKSLLDSSFADVKSRLEVNKNGIVNEVLLFHGTKPAAVDPICRNGFDCVKHAWASGNFGAGNYFTDVSMKADSYASCDEPGHFQMFLCRAILGDFYETPVGKNAQYTFRPPCIHGHYNEFVKQQPSQTNEKNRRFPSCADHREADSVIGGWPREFVLYENNRVYPEYIVEYIRL